MIIRHLKSTNIIIDAQVQVKCSEMVFSRDRDGPYKTKTITYT